ncbi:MAG TPA: ATP-binding protein, partial [Geobacteraceae bacterium]|nr:ATP-binding protein [Geobacteraceae bacterium]
LVTQYSTAAEKVRVRLTFHVSRDLQECILDRTTFIRMIGNLLSNALKFTPEGGEITVTADIPEDVASVTSGIPKGLYPATVIPKNGRYLRVTVMDTGVGIPAESLGTIFDRFVQAQNRRQGKASGTGLGLAFCRKVMDAHHGIIWAESEDRRGSSFIALFPLDLEASAFSVRA